MYFLLLAGNGAECKSDIHKHTLHGRYCNSLSEEGPLFRECLSSYILSLMCFREGHGLQKWGFVAGS